MNDASPISAPLQWEGRDVRLVEYSIRAGREVRAAFDAATTAEDRERAAFLLLTKALHYADTGEPVFASVEEVEALPSRLFPRIMRLTTRAIDEVGGFEPDGDARPPT